ncbi:MAG: prepilin-type N-terminal cleavage/methylation domain-containing protein [bacterium]|nr:prepilin-type N-terminal cleavage/methylation domain-containing protein [bacterium]MDD5353593.1 prepilin-type N-terminal cleavage/methylation domain-containing protein [bacterium]MDD5757333.1 prepilin-type N-terminal cleavage/methylation domain-containing protein [bacterium]
MAFSEVKNKNGLTLIELMIVVTIIGILASIGIPRYISFTKRAKEGATKGTLGVLRSTLGLYYADTESYPLFISCDPANAQSLYTNDGLGWEIHNDFQQYVYELPECKIGPEPSLPWQHTRSDVYHLGIASPGPIDPGSNNVGWLYFRSTDTIRGLAYLGKFFVYVEGTDNTGTYYSSW